MIEDMLIMVDTQDHPLGPCKKMQAHQSARLHRAFSVFLCCDGNMLLQRRAAGKYHSGGLWANACCSHPRWGETLGEAVTRRLWEELNICPPVNELFSFLYMAEFSNGLSEYELDHVFLGECDQIPDFAPSEISEMRFVSFSQLRKELVDQPQQFAPWFLIAAPRVLDYLEQCGTER